MTWRGTADEAVPLSPFLATQPMVGTVSSGTAPAASVPATPVSADAARVTLRNPQSRPAFEASTHLVTSPVRSHSTSYGAPAGSGSSPTSKSGRSVLTPGSNR